jgi:GPI transamidase subunit PIG-U
LLLIQICQLMQVGTPVTAAIRYREGAQLAALGLSPYAGAAFHGPPLLLAGARLLDAAAASAFPGSSILAPPWRVLATSAADVLAAAALARLAAASATGLQPSKHGSGGAKS